MIDRIAFTLFGIDIYWYGIITALACFAGIALAMKRSKNRGYDSEYIIDFMILALPVSYICARLYYVLFELDFYLQNPLEIFAIRDGGIAIYGGVIGGILCVYLFSKFYKKPKPTMLVMADILAPSLILGQAIGRWGNFVNQEAYSHIVAPDWMKFPLAVYIENIQQWRLATFFYESVWNLMVFVMLMVYAKKERKPGNVALLYIIGYSFGRMFIEGLRSDSLWLIPDVVRVSQLLAFICVVGGSLVFYLYNRKKGIKNV